MTKDQKIIRAKAGLLELAKQLGNVSQACKIMGYSRDSFYRFKAEIGGGELTATEEMIVSNCALAKMKSEEQAAKLAAGEDVSDEDAVSVGSAWPGPRASQAACCSRAASMYSCVRAAVAMRLAWSTSGPFANSANPIFNISTMIALGLTLLARAISCAAAHIGAGT